MNGPKALLDSNILIYLTKNEINFDNIYHNYDNLFISVITYMEVLGYIFENEREKEYVKKVIENFDVINLEDNIVERVIKIKQLHRIKLPDAIILATAIVNDCDLITRNLRDFQNIEKNLRIINPFA